MRQSLNIVSLIIHVATVGALPLKKFASASFHEKALAPNGRCGSMFVAVISSPQNSGLRDSSRQMWRDAGDGWGNVLAKYAICTKGGVSADLKEENDLYGDMLFMDDCEEGYLNGVLTRKIATAMETYLQDYKSYPYFMKIDDDTFISTRRLCELLRWRSERGADNLMAYMGVFAEGPHEAMTGPSSQHFPNRDSTSQWYEPESKFADKVYPASAKGGTGYILSRSLVEPIIEEKIAAENELNNEDKAVGVWVDKLAQEGGQEIEIVNFHGTDGYAEHKDSIVTTGSYKKYPHLLHHHLPGWSIACLHKVDSSGDAEMTVDDCFDHTEQDAD